MSGSTVSSSRSSSCRSELEAYELLEVAHRMVRDGYLEELIQSSMASPDDDDDDDNDKDDDALVQRWFTELDVDWVLHVNQGSLQELDVIALQSLVERWTRALFLVVQVLRREQQQLRDRMDVARRSWLSWLPRSSASRGLLRREIQLTRLAGASIARMLPFVDVLAAVAAADRGRAPAILPGMLNMYASIADASPGFLALCSCRGWRQQAGEPSHRSYEFHGTFERKRKALSQAIWTKMEQAKSSILTTRTPGVSPPSQEVAGSIHKITRSMMRYVRLLWNNDVSVSFILQDHHLGCFVSEAEGLSSLLNLMADLVSGLQDLLAKQSEALPEDGGGHRYLFLLNNAYFIADRINSLCLPSSAPPFDDRTEGYLKCYLDSAWAPVLDRLYNKARFFSTKYSSLYEFESRFERTYAAQKFLIVLSPELRQRLRKAIIQRVVTAYRTYLQDGLLRHGKTIDVSITGRRTLQELEELLAELFEG